MATKAKGRQHVEGSSQLATLGDVAKSFKTATSYSDAVGKAVYDQWIRPLEARVGRLEAAVQLLERRPWWKAPWRKP